MTKNMTVADIARKAGVSMMTVSRVINRKSAVSEKTRRRVQKVIDQLGYRPSGIARSLATRRSGTIGLVIPDVSNPFFADVARGAEAVAYKEGYSVFLCNTEESPQRERKVMLSLEERWVDGVVVVSRLKSRPLALALEHFPAAVLINHIKNSRAASPGVGSVRLDDILGGRLVTRHLIGRGHRAIGFLSGPASSHSGIDRAKGYRQILAEEGLAPNPRWESHCAPTVEGGQSAARELLRARPEITALFCYNDLVAVGALQAAAECGRSVPRDLSVAGYDDIPLAALVTPPLTTCRAPRYDLGAEAVRLLLARIRGCTEPPEETILPPRLIIRASAP